MKKIIALTLCVLLLLACASCTKSDEDTEASPASYDTLCVDIGVKEDGYYAFMSKADVYYGQEGKISRIYLDNPTLLAFRVSSEMDGGVYLLKKTAGDSAIDTLTEVAEELRAGGDDNLANRIDAVIAIIGNAGPYTQAST